jgi:ABC-type transporter Mla maintaining outer membrane lipid asymmetry ATPase subunit MlaF
MVFQSAALFDSLTVGENVGFLLYEKSNLPVDRIEQLVAESLSMVGLQGVEGRYPAQLSGGMKKRVALARAIITDGGQSQDATEEVRERFYHISLPHACSRPPSSC